MAELSFKCPVCTNSTLTWDGKERKIECDNCGTVFKHEFLIAKDTFALKKLGDQKYKDVYEKLRLRQLDLDTGLEAHEWDSIANGGYTDKESATLKKESIDKEKEEKLINILTVTTPNLEGKPIKEYLGIVSGQALTGINIFKDVFAGIRNVVGGRSEALQSSMKKMREEVLNEMKEEAINKGANAIVGISFDFDEYGEGMMMLTASGTAVLIE